MFEKLFYMLPFNRVKTLVFPVFDSKTNGNNLNIFVKKEIGKADLPSLIKDKKKVIDVLVIPEGVEEIKRETFEECKIRKIILPKSLKRIGFSAFSRNKFLEEVILPEGLEYIGLYAFYATSLKEVNVPDSVKVLENSAFSECKKLKKVKLPSNLTKIEDRLFQWSSIKSIDIPESVKVIDSSTFWGCNKLKKVKLPERLEKLGSNVFSYSGVKKIYLNYNIKEISENLFEYNKNTKKVIIEFPNKKGELVKHEINRGLFKFIKIDKNKDGIVINRTPLSIKNINIFFNTTVISVEGKFNFNSYNLFKLTKNINVFKENIYKGIETLLPKWIDGIEKRKKGGQNVLLPNPSIISNYSTNIKDIVRYYIVENKFKELSAKIGIAENENSGSLLKACYALGLFSDNKQESERAYNFIKDKLTEKLSAFDINNIFGSLRSGIPYNREFAKFYIETFKERETFEIEGTDITIKMIEQFKDIADSIKNQKKQINLEDVIRFLSSQKYEYREGNGVLAMTISNYSEFYTQRKFDELQEIFEKGKELAKNGGKIIAQTSDKEIKKASYFWSPSDNPINLVLGHADKASCCAKLDGAGKEIMISAVTSQDVQNLIIFDRNRNIIGKGTAYYNQEGRYILFNNAEINPTWLQRATKEEKEEVVDAFLRAAKDQAKALNSKAEEPVITKIHMGMHLNDVSKEIEAKKLKVIKEELLENKKYGYYAGDANRPEGQVVLYELEGGKQK